MSYFLLKFFSTVFDPILFILAGNNDLRIRLHESELDKIRPLTSELAALGCPKKPQIVPHASLFFFYFTFVKIAGNQDRHKRVKEFDFGHIQTADF